MEREPSLRTIPSAVYDLYNYSIAEQFLDVARYKQTRQNCKKGAFFYEKLCSELQRYYQLILEIPNKCQPLLANNPHMEKWEISKFKTFLRNLFEIFNLISEFQIDGLSTLRFSQIEVNDFYFSFDDFIGKIEQYREQQIKLKQANVFYRRLLGQLEQSFSVLQQTMKKPENFFNMKLVAAELAAIQQKISNKSKIQNEISQLTEIISENSRNFQKNFMFLKQRLIKCRYEHMHKISKLCKNSKQSLIEIFTYLQNFLKMNKGLFKSKPSDLEGKKITAKSGLQVSMLIITETNEYKGILQEYIAIINKLIDSLTSVTASLLDMKKSQTDLLENIGRYDENKECDLQEVSSVLKLYNLFLKHLGELGDRLVFSVNNIIQLQKNINKCSEMTLTLSKCKPTSPQASYSRRKGSFNDKQSQLESSKFLDVFNEEMSVCYIQGILQKVYQDFTQCLSKIKNQFMVNQPNKRKTIDNSMQISYVSQVSSPTRKKPSKCEIWLWKTTWKEEITKQLQDIQPIQKYIKQLQALVALSKNEDKELQKLNCKFQKKKLPGFLSLKEHCLLFQANNGSLALFIPLSEIQKVDIESSLMSNTLLVQTTVGKLSFIASAQGKLNKFFVNIDKALDYHNEHNEQQVPEAKIVMTEQQIEFIQKRKVECGQHLQSLDEYEQMQKIRLLDVSIVDFYKVVYSGDPIVIKGKEYQNFEDSLTLKLNNFNAKFGKYDKPGPMYYSGSEGFDFTNCPFYSQRIVDYDHKLPKIPLVPIPESCHNTQTKRVYWISHQEFQIRQWNVATNAPFVDNFIMVGLVVAKQVQRDVEVIFYCKVVEINDFAMKSLVYSSSKKEFRWGLDIFIQQVKKVMAKYKRKGDNQKSNHSEPQEVSINSNNTVIKKYKTTIKQLQTKNSRLIYLMAGVFLINLILYIFF